MLNPVLTISQGQDWVKIKVKVRDKVKVNMKVNVNVNFNLKFNVQVNDIFNAQVKINVNAMFMVYINVRESSFIESNSEDHLCLGLVILIISLIPQPPIPTHPTGTIINMS